MTDPFPLYKWKKKPLEEARLEEASRVVSHKPLVFKATISHTSIHKLMGLHTTCYCHSGCNSRTLPLFEIRFANNFNSLQDETLLFSSPSSWFGVFTPIENQHIPQWQSTMLFLLEVHLLMHTKKLNWSL